MTTTTWRLDIEDPCNYVREEDGFFLTVYGCHGEPWGWDVREQTYSYQDGPDERECADGEAPTFLAAQAAADAWVAEAIAAQRAADEELGRFLATEPYAT